jgi:LuxR family transcriptional regulator, maltose regulon positive regulatory protein
MSPAGRPTDQHTEREEAEARVSNRAPRVVLTKLQPPLLRTDALPRQRLLDRLRGVLYSHPLTLISAPAGYGKTTLLATLPHAFPDLPLGWLSLDEEDNDPAQFLGALIAALQRLHPACGVDAEILLSNLGDPGSEARRVVGTLVNEVLEAMPEPFVLVLDDLHVITEPEIYAVLDYLIERLPPQMHLAVASRRDPPVALARLRARRQLTELRLADLRFTLGEAEEFLNNKLKLGLSAEHLAILQDRTEGWAVGISLMASSLERLPGGRDAFITQLARSDRHIFEFLAEEVLDGQEPAVRDLLLESSILTELTPALCAAVTGRDDARVMLEELFLRNLFLVAVDEPSETFRYHDLFKEFLLGRLEREVPERVRELHRRAAEAETVPSRVVRHYLAAGMWSEAASAVEHLGEQLLQQGSLDTLRGWIGALPEESREGHPRLTYLLGRCAWMTWELDTAKTLLKRALEGFEAIDDEAGQIESLVHLATCLSTMADVEGAAAATERALTFPLPPYYRAQVLVESAWIELAKKNWVRTNANLDEALALAEASRDPRTLHAIALDFNSPFTVLPGGVERAERLCHLLSAHIGKEISPLQVAVHDLMTFVHLWRGRWEEAIQSGERSLKLSEQFGGQLLSDLEVGAALPICHALRGDHATADQHFEALFRGLEQPGTETFTGPWIAGMLYLLGRTRWLQGRLEEAREAYVRMRAAENAREWPIAPVVRAMMQGLLHVSEWRYADAERSLRQAAALQHEVRFSTLFGNADLLLAHLYRLQDRPEGALAVLEPVLAEHERRGTPGFILWEGDTMVPLLRLAIERDLRATFAAHVLDLFGVAHEVRPMHVPETGETLTRREVEVLRLISAGAANKEIAEELVLSIHTVKRHVAHVLRKLDVSSRTQAAARARELGVI